MIHKRDAGDTKIFSRYIRAANSPLWWCGRLTTRETTNVPPGTLHRSTKAIRPRLLSMPNAGAEGTAHKSTQQADSSVLSVRWSGRPGCFMERGIVPSEHRRMNVRSYHISSGSRTIARVGIANEITYSSVERGNIVMREQFRMLRTFYIRLHVYILQQTWVRRARK